MASVRALVAEFDREQAKGRGANVARLRRLADRIDAGRAEQKATTHHVCRYAPVGTPGDRVRLRWAADGRWSEPCPHCGNRVDRRDRS